MAQKTKGRPNKIDIYAGEQLKKWRTVKGMSQVKLGILLGITFQQIQKYEKGVNRMSAGRLWDICIVLEIGLLDLFPARAHENANSGLAEIQELQARSRTLQAIENTLEKAAA